MLVRRAPRHPQAWRPIVLPGAAILAWDVAVTAIWLNRDSHFDGLEIQFSLFGTAIALFTGFAVNAAYGRWWEARSLWGQIVNGSRNLARQCLVFIDSSAQPSRRDVVDRIVRAQIAYVHILRTSLRGQALPAEAHLYLSPTAMSAAQTSTNAAVSVLTGLDRCLTEAEQAHALSVFSRVQIETTLVSLTDAQGGLERIKNTPLPVQYRFLPRVFSRVFCLILPFAVVKDLGWATPIGSGLVSLMFLLAVQIADQLAEPFADSIYDVPMTALCRTVEIDLLELLGQPSPERVTPVDNVLW